MNEITCDLCMDLMPLVRDGIASEDSQKAVELHVKTCTACSAFYRSETPPAVNMEKTFHKFQRQMHLFSIILMVFGVFFGLGLTAGADMLYNSLIMPVIGALAYMLFRWKALYKAPVLLLIAHGLINGLRLLQETEPLNLYSLFMWTVLYSIFTLIGTLIAGLLHYAFRKEH